MADRKNPKKMVTPKNYWKKKRTDNHAYWPFGFFRELFQNSTDAGAKNVHITLSEAPGRGAFGRDSKLENVIRVVFSDDGTGMTKGILDDVFFSPGETSKTDGTTTGGFGTARTMTCFSQVRYSGRTGDLYFEGDGSEYEIMPTPEAIEYYRELVIDTEDQPQKEEIQAILASMQADSKTRKGCRFEIDIDPTETIGYGRQINLNLIKDALDDYLVASNLPCRVFINGEENTKKTTKGPMKRVLSAEKITGEVVEFATIHTSMGEKAKHKGKVIVRVNGATMFIMPITSQNQVIVELKPELSRQAMTDNRDGLKSPFSYALTSFIEELSTDVRSAMQTKDEKRHTVIQGGLGEQIVYRKKDFKPSNIDFNHKTENQDIPEATYRVDNIEDIREVYLEAFVANIKNGQLIEFLDEFHDQDDISMLVENIRDIGVEAFKDLKPELATFIASNINRLAIENGANPTDIRYSQMHNVHIYREDSFKKDTVMINAINRLTPNYWRFKGEEGAGRGIKANEVLETWNIMCRHVMDAMAESYPDIAKNGVQFGTGWVFAKEQDAWVNNQYQKMRLEAKHIKKENTHLLLLNPILPDGSLAYDVNKDDDDGVPPYGLSTLLATAIHEGAHILGDRHDEDFAGVYTKLVSQFITLKRQKNLRIDVQNALAGIGAAYGRGKSRVQSLDSQIIQEMETSLEYGKKTKKPKEKTRPAQILMAQAMPITTVVAGIAMAPENRGKADEIELILTSLFTDIGDGVMEVDNDRMQKLEKNMATAVETSLIHDSRQIDLEDAIEIVKNSEAETKISPEPKPDVLSTYDNVLSSLMQSPLPVVKAVVTKTIVDKPSKENENKTSEKPHRPRVASIPDFSRFSIREDEHTEVVAPALSLVGYDDILGSLVDIKKPDEVVKTTTLLGGELDMEFDLDEPTTPANNH